MTGVDSIVIKTHIFTGCDPESVALQIDQFWVDLIHKTVRLLAQTQSECYIALDECWSLTITVTVQIND